MKIVQTLETQLSSIEKSIADFSSAQTIYNGQLNFIINQSYGLYDSSVAANSANGVLSGVVTWRNDSKIVPWCQIIPVVCVTPGVPTTADVISQTTAIRFEALYAQGNSISWRFKYTQANPSMSVPIYIKYYVISNDTGVVSSATWSWS